MALEDIGVRVLVLGLGEFRRAVGTARDDLRDLEGQVRSVSHTSAGLGTTLTRIGSGMVGLGRAMTLAITTPLALITGSLINAGIQFEDTFAGIAKTADGVAIGFDEIAAAAKSQLGITVTTMEQAKQAAEEMGMAFGDLTSVGVATREEFRQMALEVPISTNELNKLGEVVGQLGVSAQDLPEVTKLVAQLGVATDISAQDAAFGLIRLGNILEGTSLDIVDFTTRAGSALVALGNASVSTEGEILQVALRLAAAGERAGFSEAQIFAWATTITDLGSRAEAGGSAVSRALNEMVLAVQTGSDNLQTFASVAGVSVDEFTRLFKEDASNALDIFVKNLQDGIKSGQVTKQMLTDMGLGGIRAIDVIGRLGEAQGILGKNLDTANEAWAEAIALQEEAEKRFQTVSSQIQLLKNSFTDLGIEIFDLLKDDIKAFIQGIRDTIQWFKNMDSQTQKTILIVAGIAAVIGPLLIILGTLVSSIGAIVTVFGALATGIGPLLVGLAAFGITMGTLVGWEEIFAAGGPVLDSLIKQLGDMVSIVGSILFPQKPESATPTSMPVSTNVAEHNQASAPAAAPPSANAAEGKLLASEDANKAAQTWLMFSAAVQTAFVIAQDVATAFMLTIQSIVGPQIQATIETLTQTLADFGLDWGDVWEAVKTVIVITAEVIGAVLAILIGVIVGVITAISSAAQMIAEVWRVQAQNLSQIVEGIIRFFAGLIGFFTNVFQGKWEAATIAIGQMTEGLRQVVVGTFEFIRDGILGVFATILAAVGGFVGGMVSFFVNLYEQLIGHSIVTDMIDDILAAFGSLKEGGFQIISELVSGIGDLFGNLFGGGGDPLGGGGDIGAQLLASIQSAIPIIQEAWAAFMTMFLETTVAGIFLIQESFSSLVVGLSASFGAVGLEWSIFIASLTGQLDGLVSTTLMAFSSMGGGVAAFSATASALFIGFVLFTMSEMSILSAFWLEIVKQMVHHWLDFVYATLALTAEWSATTQGELAAIGNAFATAATAASTSWNAAVVSMMADTNAVIANQAVAIAGFAGVGSAAGAAATAVEIAAARMIGAMEAVLAAATGSPELKIQHPFERFEKYLKQTDYGSLMEKSMATPAINNSINTMIPASALAGSSSVDNSINVGDINGAPLQTKDDVIDTMTRFVRIRGSGG